MPLTITSRTEDQIGVLELSGTLKLGPTLHELRNKARELVEGKKVKGLIVEVSEITQTDSSGLGELTAVYSVASKKHCPMRLVGVSPELRKLLTFTRLDGVLPSSPDIASAKRDFKGDNSTASARSGA